MITLHFHLQLQHNIISYIFYKNKTFTRPSRAVIISVNFFPVLGKSATWNDHYSGYKRTGTHKREFEVSFVALTPHLGLSSPARF